MVYTANWVIINHRSHLSREPGNSYWLKASGFFFRSPPWCLLHPGISPKTSKSNLRFEASALESAHETLERQQQWRMSHLSKISPTGPPGRWAPRTWNTNSLWFGISFRIVKFWGSLGYLPRDSMWQNHWIWAWVGSGAELVYIPAPSSKVRVPIKA